MALSTAGRNALVDGLASVTSHYAVHDGVPSDAGSLEVGSTTRQAVTWTAAAGGVRDNVGSVSFSMPAASGATHGGLWSALSAGTFRGSAPINGLRGVGTVDTADVTANAITSPARTVKLTALLAVNPPKRLVTPANLSTTSCMKPP